MESLRALAALSEPPGPATPRLSSSLGLAGAPGESDWSDLFLFQLYPYASVYLGREGRIGGEPRDRIAGFWRALGADPPVECDHLAILLAFYAELGDRAAAASDPASRERWTHAQRAFLHEHLLSWLPLYLAKLALVAPPFYRRWGRLLAELLAAESTRHRPPDELCLHWRAAPRPADPRRDGSRAFLESLLAPLATGLILVRGDLERAARELDLALRVGERRFLLETLLAQDGAAVLGWLERHCRGWRKRLAAPHDDDLPVGAFWLDRADATADLLAELALDGAVRSR